MRRVWRRYNLGIVLGALFVGNWVGQTWTGWQEFVAERRAIERIERRVNELTAEQRRRSFARMTAD